MDNKEQQEAIDYTRTDSNLDLLIKESVLFNNQVITEGNKAQAELTRAKAKFWQRLSFAVMVVGLALAIAVVAVAVTL